MAVAQICQIPANSDIAGIGVRASVYVQACLASINVIFLMHIRVYSDSDSPSTDIETAPSEQVASTSMEPQVQSQSVPTPPHPTHPSPKFLMDNAEYLNISKTLERSLFMIGFAVILSAILETKSPSGLTPYHALIVLNISQINNLAGTLLLISRGGVRNVGSGGWIGEILVTQRSLVDAMPCIVHGTVMSAFGLYFWSDTQAFLKYGNGSGSCQPLTIFWVFGRVSVTNNSLRIASLVFYAINIIPMVGFYFQITLMGLVLIAYFFVALPAVALGLFLVVMILIILFAGIDALVLKPLLFVLKPIFRAPIIRVPVSALSKCLEPSVHTLRQVLRSTFTNLHSQTMGLLVGPSYSFPFTFTTRLVFVFPLIYTVISTELTIRANESNVKQSAENKWTYGQTLALMTALIAVGMYIREAWKLLKKGERERENSMGGSSHLRLTVEQYVQTDDTLAKSV